MADIVLSVNICIAGIYSKGRENIGKDVRKSAVLGYLFSIPCLLPTSSPNAAFRDVDFYKKTWSLSSTRGGSKGRSYAAAFSSVEIAAVAAVPRAPTSTLGRLNQPAKIPETTELRRGEPRCGTENCA